MLNKGSILVFNILFIIKSIFKVFIKNGTKYYPKSIINWWFTYMFYILVFCLLQKQYYYRV